MEARCAKARIAAAADLFVRRAVDDLQARLARTIPAPAPTPAVPKPPAVPRPPRPPPTCSRNRQAKTPTLKVPPKTKKTSKKEQKTSLPEQEEDEGSLDADESKLGLRARNSLELSHDRMLKSRSQVGSIYCFKHYLFFADYSAISCRQLIILVTCFRMNDGDEVKVDRH
jgi:hypothetical protein